MNDINLKLSNLNDKLSAMKRVLVAFSGGVDSTFLLAAAVKSLGAENVLAATAVSETYPAAELALAKKTTKKLKVKHEIINTSELANKNFSSNPKDRCFYCKDELFNKLSTIAVKNKMVLCDATNYSDLTDYRPGRRAAKKWKVASPLLDSKLTKDDIRLLSRKMNLPTWNMPAQACLASRIPYGTSINPEDLIKIEKGEILLKKAGFPIVRLRHHGDILRIEIDKNKIPLFITPKIQNKIIPALKKLGWRFITLDLEGYRTGSMN